MAKYKSLNDITEILNDYSQDIQEGITQSALEIAENGKNKLKATSPRRKVNGGKYARGWRVDKRQGKGFVHATIYNATDWQLTHLLEKPHALRNGKRSTPIIHIEPVEKECVSSFQKDVEHIIKNGG